MKLAAALGLTLATTTISACDLPGAHQNDAAVVNGHAIPRSAYDHIVDVTTQQLKSHVPFDPNSDQGKQQVQNLRVQALRALVREEVIEEMAAQRGVKVTTADLDRQVQQLRETLGGDVGLNQRLDSTDETIDDLRHTIRINLLQSRMRAASSSFESDYNRALNNAQVNAYAPPCESDHGWPQCAGGQR